MLFGVVPLLFSFLSRKQLTGMSGGTVSYILSPLGHYVGEAKYQRSQCDQIGAFDDSQLPL